MAKIMIKALAVAALVCLVVDLAASDSDNQYQQPSEQYTVTDSAAADVPSTTAASSSFKDKFKGFVSSVKEGAVDAYESVSESVSEASHSLDEKRKEVVAGTKKLVNGAIEKIKTKYDSFKSGEKDATAAPGESSEESIDKPALTNEYAKTHHSH